MLMNNNRTAEQGDWMMEREPDLIEGKCAACNNFTLVGPATETCSICSSNTPIENIPYEGDRYGEPVPVPVPVPGIKHDSGKPDWSLLPVDATEAVVRVLTHGAKKYGRDNWKTVPDAEHRYISAAYRHIASHRRGEKLDQESGLPHLAHAICSLMFLLES